MKKLNNRKLGKGGFTLIEVVLVLAIGGLIFLLAFLAFQQATQNRRDTQRRSDAGRVISEIENAMSDGNGTTFSDPTTMSKFVQSYLAGSQVTGAGGAVTGAKFENNNIVYSLNYGTPPTAGIPAISSSTATMYVSQKAKCSGNEMDQQAAYGKGDYAVVVRLEKGQACRDNQ